MPLVQSIRRLVRRIDETLSHLDVDTKSIDAVPSRERYDDIVAFVRPIDQPGPDQRQYLENHISRIGRTLTLVPPPTKSKRVLEMVAYMHMTPALQCVLGYTEVRGAYFEPLGKTDEKSVPVRRREVFPCFVDLFDAENDSDPYPD